MKNNSKKKDGFTLIEVIICMAIIGILSTGIYSGYKLIIGQTKAGEMKQQSSLIGKQITEEIKAVYSEKDIKKSQGTINLGNIKLSENDSCYFGSSYFDKDGKAISSKDRKAKYEAQITMKPKTTYINNDDEAKGKGSQVEIKDFSDNIKGNKAYVIKNGSEIAFKKSKVDSEDITADVDFYLNVLDDYKLLLSGRNASSEISYVFNKDDNTLNLDLKPCVGKVIINVNNSTKIPLNLCILNKNEDNVKVSNEKGVLNEYYRSESDGKVGLLYDITIKVYDKKDKTTLYEENFVQNVDIQEFKD